jgi:hypothetical protein
MRKTIDEILSAYRFYLDVEIRIQGMYRGKTIITGIPSPEGLATWFTLRDLRFPQQIYVSALDISPELRNNAILDITGKLRKRNDGLFYFEGNDLV